MITIKRCYELQPDNFTAIASLVMQRRTQLFRTGMTWKLAHAQAFSEIGRDRIIPPVDGQAVLKFYMEQTRNKRQEAKKRKLEARALHGKVTP